MRERTRREVERKRKTGLKRGGAWGGEMGTECLGGGKEEEIKKEAGERKGGKVFQMGEGSKRTPRISCEKRA